MAITVRIDHCSMVGQSPCTHDGTWKLYSFSSRHLSAFQDANCKYNRIEDILPDGKVPIWLRSKLRAGTAFFLDYFEHGDGVWSRTGCGPQCQFDNVKFAGIAIWEDDLDNLGAKTVEERAKDLDNELEIYNEWMNGHTYQYLIETDDGIIDDSCGGFIGDADLVSAINEVIAERCVDEDVEICGECSFIGNYHKIAGQVPREVWDERQALLEVGANI